MLIYNLFPTLAGRFKDWKPHLQRAASMGFNWVFVNPVQEPGFSGSLYSIKDYTRLNPALCDPQEDMEPDGQLMQAIRDARELGMEVMLDLVINHTAIDSPLTHEHPDWYEHDKKGGIAHPFAMDGGKKVVWGDLARLDHERTTDPEGLYAHIRGVVEHLAALGFRGFRCDAAYQVPADIWQRLISETRADHPGTVFAAETLGCSPEETIRTARAGFDYIFNSSKWWDFKSPWLLEQYEQSRHVARSISFPESHDTERLAEEFKADEAAIRARYMFSALFSGGVMIPMGFELGFRKRLSVVSTGPDNWEDTTMDLRTFIRDVNAIKTSSGIFLIDAPTEISGYNKEVVMMRKEDDKTSTAALVMINMTNSKTVNITHRELLFSARMRGEITLLAPGSPPRSLSSGQSSDAQGLSLSPGEGAVLMGEAR